MLSGTAGTMQGWAVRDRPLLGAGKRHPLAPAQPPWAGTGSGKEPWGCCASGRPRAVDTGGDTVGSRRRGQTHLPGPGELPGGCFGIPSRVCRPRRLKSEDSAQIEPHSALAPHHLLPFMHSPCAGDSTCITPNPPAPWERWEVGDAQHVCWRGLGFEPQQGVVVHFTSCQDSFASFSG